MFRRIVVCGAVCVVSGVCRSWSVGGCVGADDDCVVMLVLVVVGVVRDGRAVIILSGGSDIFFLLRGVERPPNKLERGGMEGERKE